MGLGVMVAETHSYGLGEGFPNCGVQSNSGSPQGGRGGPGMAAIIGMNNCFI